MTADPAQLRQQMVDAVTADDYLTSWRTALTPWRSSLLAVPRHRFIPDTVWVDNDGDAPPALVPLHREQAPDRWLSLAYGASDGVATQVDDGHSAGPGPGGSLPSSSASGPIIVAVMLALLALARARPDGRALAGRPVGVLGQAHPHHSRPGFAWRRPRSR